MVHQSQFIARYGTSSNCHFEELNKNVSELFIGPFGSSLKNECFVGKDKAYCVVYEQKHAIEKSVGLPFRYVDYGKYKELQRFEILPGDIIVSCRGTVGEVFLIPHGAPVGIMHPSIMKIRLNPISYIADFFVFAVEEYMRERESKNLGTGVKMAVTAGEMGKDFFPKPSLGEQKAFVNVVRQADKSKFDGLKSQFIEMFGCEPIENCKWPTQSFGEMFEISSSRRILKDDWAQEGVPFLRVRDLIHYTQTGELKNEFFVSESFYNKMKDADGKVQDGDILVSATSTIGKCLVVRNGERFYYKDADVLRFREKAPINKTFFVYGLSMPTVENQINDTIGKTTVGHFLISKAAIIKQPIPPAPLQEEFEQVVRQADKSKYLN